MNITTSVRGAFTVLTVTGEIDVSSAAALRESVIRCVDGGERDLVIDLDAVTFLDSTGLGVLVGGRKRVEPYGGTLALVCGQPRILRILSITGLTRIFPVHASLDAAVSAGRPQLAPHGLRSALAS